MASPWAAAILTRLNQVRPDGADIMTIQRNFESFVVSMRQFVKAMDEGIEAAIAAGDIELPAVPVPVIVDVGDETTALTTGTTKKTLRLPQAMTLAEVRASVGTAPTGSVITVDINVGGVSILSTKLTIDAGSKTSVGATAPVVISSATHADDAEVTIDIDTVGSGTAGAGLKVYLIGSAT